MSSPTPFLPFAEALAAARALQLTSSTEWRAWCKDGLRPAKLPAAPDRVYKHAGWQGWGHYLGTGNTFNSAQVFLPFDEAARVGRALKLVNRAEWLAWCQQGTRPANVPADPSKTYKGAGWLGWGNWLGTGNESPSDQQRRFLPFAQARTFVVALKLRSWEDWQAWCKSGARPANVPAAPYGTYKHTGWRGAGHWLGTGTTVGGSKKVFLPHDEALPFVRSLQLTGKRAWVAWSSGGSRPANIPSNPQTTYLRHGWQGFTHWLGSAEREAAVLRDAAASKRSRFAPFEEAAAVARSLGLRSASEWYAWGKSGARPTNLPCQPDKIYKCRGWQGWGHWLGTGNACKKAFLPFEEALAVTRSLGLASHKAWCAWCKKGLRPANLPSNAHTVYKDAGWRGWGHWLGTGGTPPPPPTAEQMREGMDGPAAPHRHPDDGAARQSQLVFPRFTTQEPGHAVWLASRKQRWRSLRPARHLHHTTDTPASAPDSRGCVVAWRPDDANAWLNNRKVKWRALRAGRRQRQAVAGSPRRIVLSSACANVAATATECKAVPSLSAYYALWEAAGRPSHAGPNTLLLQRRGKGLDRAQRAWFRTLPWLQPAPAAHPPRGEAGVVVVSEGQHHSNSHSGPKAAQRRASSPVCAAPVHDRGPLPHARVQEGRGHALLVQLADVASSQGAPARGGSALPSGRGSARHGASDMPPAAERGCASNEGATLDRQLAACSTSQVASRKRTAGGSGGLHSPGGRKRVRLVD